MSKFSLKTLITSILLGVFALSSVNAAPYATTVIDARDGTVLYSQNANATLHPASLTKMMTLYIAFAEVSAGRISLEADVKISANAASKPASKIGLRAGTTMKFKYLLRAAAIKSANDAATAIAEAIAGSEANFAVYMTQTARQLGMRNSVFKNPHGLTSNGHYSTAADMAILGRHLIYDYPDFYQLFSREYAETPLGNFQASNIRFLRDYPGADGIKTGYTQAAGYNLVATAVRGTERVLVSMFGGQSSYQRNEQVGALLDLGFSKAPASVRVSNIARPNLPGVQRVVSTEPEPAPETLQPDEAPAETAPVETAQAPKTDPDAPVILSTLNDPNGAANLEVTRSSALAPAYASRPSARPSLSGVIVSSPVPEEVTPEQIEAAVNAGTSGAAPEPTSRPSSVNTDVDTSEVTVYSSKRGSDSQTAQYAIQLSAIPTKEGANELMIAAQSAAHERLADAKTNIVSVSGGYRPKFTGFTKESAYATCADLKEISEECYVLAPAN